MTPPRDPYPIAQIVEAWYTSGLKGGVSRWPRQCCFPPNTKRSRLKRDQIVDADATGRPSQVAQILTHVILTCQVKVAPAPAGKERSLEEQRQKTIPIPRDASVPAKGAVRRHQEPVPTDRRDLADKRPEFPAAMGKKPGRYGDGGYPPVLRPEEAPPILPPPRQAKE